MVVHFRQLVSLPTDEVAYAWPYRVLVEGFFQAPRVKNPHRVGQNLDASSHLADTRGGLEDRDVKPTIRLAIAAPSTPRPAPKTITNNGCQEEMANMSAVH